MITLSASLARPGWLVGLRADYRHGFPRRVLFEIRHVPPEFSAARPCDLRQCLQWPHISPRFLSLRINLVATDLRPVCLESGTGHRPVATALFPRTKNKTCRAT